MPNKLSDEMEEFSDEMEEFYDVLPLELKELTPTQRLEALHPANHNTFESANQASWYLSAYTRLARNTGTKGWNTKDLEFLQYLEDYVARFARGLRHKPL